MTAEKKVGLFFVSGLVILLLLTMTVEDLRIPFFRDEYKAVAYFDSISDLRVGNTVTVSGVPVGRIRDFKLERDRVRVTFSVDARHEIPVDSEAEIVLTSLLGGSHLNISLGESNEYIEDGAELSSKEVITTGDIVKSVSEVSTSVHTLAANFDENQDQFFRRINNLIDENEEKVNTIIANFEKSSENMNETFEQLDKTLADVDTISKNFAHISEDLVEGRGTIGKLLQDDEVYENLYTLTHDVQDITQTLQKQESLLGKLMYSEEMGEDFEVTVRNTRQFSERMQFLMSEKGDEIEDIISNLHASSQSLNVMSRRLLVISEQLEDGEGTLGKLLADEELYEEVRTLVLELRDTVRNVEETVIDHSVFGVILSGMR